MRYHVVDDSGNNVGELGQFSVENGGVFLGGTLFALAIIWLIIKAIVALLTFLLPALLGAAIAAALGRPWGRISGGLMAGTGAYGIAILHNGLVLHSSHQDARGPLGVGCALCGFAIVLLGLKLREVVRVRRDGYDDSPWTLQYLGSWAVVIAPLLVALFFGTVAVLATANIIPVAHKSANVPFYAAFAVIALVLAWTMMAVGRKMRADIGNM